MKAKPLLPADFWRRNLIPQPFVLGP
jgi:hypothetical protein